MKKVASALCVAAMLIAGTQASYADQTVAKANGKCKMTNVEAMKVLYDGECKIKESVSSETGNIIFSITMGSDEPFLFAGKGDSWMHGPSKVKFAENGNSATFTWDNFILMATTH